MGFNVLIKSLAFVDLQNAIDWYEIQSTGLGKRFYKEFENCISRIENNPHHYRVYHKNVRRILFNKFPYKIFYSLNEQTVIVLGIYHGKRSKSFVNRRMNLINE